MQCRIAASSQRRGPGVTTVRAVLLLAAGVLAAPAARSFAEDGASAAGRPTASFSSFLAQVPAEARPVAPVLQQVFRAYTAHEQAQRDLRQLRLAQDGVKTKLATVSGELKVLGEHRQRAEQELAALEREQDNRLAALRKDLEARLAEELVQTRQLITEELQGESNRLLQTFEARQQAAIDKTLDQELNLKERELQQLSQEIELQTQDLLDRLARVEADPALASSIEHAMQEVLARRKAELEARRSHLRAERDAYIARGRAQFGEQLKSEQALELQRRLTVQEATLRQSMAELLHQTRRQDAAYLQAKREEVAGVQQRHQALAQEQAALQGRVEELDREMTAKLHRAESVQAERQVSLARLEQAFQRPHADQRVGAIAWLTEAIQQAPAELATELSLLQQRLVTQVREEKQLEEQSRILRERQLALQVAREMEARYQQARLAEQRERDAASRKAEDLITRAGELAGKGRFDEALRLVSQAKALNPPQMSRVAVLQEQLLADRERARREAQTAELERLFARAMETFHQGQYEESVGLFERVIAQEAELEGASRGTP
ncbi:MAG: hypothetical protein HYZ96_02040 [Candidatus Omnitrophica bacterium]|nr:hypothetical protein [Candidatus Omnitrophota bacterium]